MTERDFAYWLQGYFELVEAGVTQEDMPAGLLPVDMPKATLNENQKQCVRNHINLVRTTQKESSLLIAIEALLEYDVPAMRKVLDAHFEHVIDPEHPDQDAANAAHTGSIFPGRPPGVRC
jgi:hypothetical protein